MYVPGFSKRLFPRKGGGGGRGGAKGSGRSGSSISSSGTKSSSSKPSSDSTGSKAPSRSPSVPVTGSTVGRSSVVSYGSGSTRVITIPSGQPFAGRTSGGGTRNNVYGTPFYGSGYPGVNGLGVANRNFPFVFWPVVWGGGLGYGAVYLHSHEYGEPNNSSRPGGPMTQAAFSSPSSNTTFHVVADNTTVAALISAISANCSSAIVSNSSKTPSPFSGAASDPLPEQAVQYYRASSISLTLDGYNNTAALSGDENVAPVPLPTSVDRTLLNCLNATIGEAAPLFSHGALRFSAPGYGLFVVMYVLWCFSSLF